MPFAGFPLDPGKMMLMKQKDRAFIGVDNIILSEEGRILLARRSENAGTFPGKWNLISGDVEAGESIEDALKREAREEAGVEIEVVRFTGRYYDRPGRHPTKTVICLPHVCRIKKGIPKVVRPEEVSEVRWFSPEEIRKLDLAYDHNQMLKDEGLI